MLASRRLPFFESGGAKRAHRHRLAACKPPAEEINRSPTSRFPSCAGDRVIDKAVCTSCRCVEGDRLERRLGSLKAILATCALDWVGGCMGPAANSASVIAETAISAGSTSSGICSISIADRCVDKSAGMPPVRHAGWCPGRLPRVGRSGGDPRRGVGRPRTLRARRRRRRIVGT